MKASQGGRGGMASLGGIICLETSKQINVCHWTRGTAAVVVVNESLLLGVCRVIMASI